MEFNFRGWDEQMQHMYHTPMKDGLWSGTSIGGGQGGVGILRGSVDMREAIHRELEKERIREEIVAEEIARKRDLEAEVRREMAMEMAMHGGGGFLSSFMLKPPLSHNNRSDPGMPRGQTFAPVSLEETYGSSGRHCREFRGYQLLPFQQLPLSGDGKTKVTHLGKPNGATLSGVKGKPTAVASSEWSCTVCKVSATCEHGFNEHLAGKKHQAKMATMKAEKAQRHGTPQKTHKKQSAEIGLGIGPKESTSVPAKLLKSKKSVNTEPSLTKNSSKGVSIDSKKEDKKTEFPFWCEMCCVGASSDKVMNAHIIGKKHLKNLLKLHQQSATKKAHNSMEKHKKEGTGRTQVAQSESIGSAVDILSL